MPDLATVDLDGVEILSTGGPVHGRGSPPAGDYWTAEHLTQIAAAGVALADEIRPPGKIGHGSDQPAAGWLENLRTNADGSKLLADVKRVPAKVADLIKAGAYRTRSVELSKVTSQKTGDVYDFAVTGMAWLGGQIPAVRTLDDVVALYEAEGVERRCVVLYETATDDDVTDSEAPADTRPTMPEPTFTEEQTKALAAALGVEGDITTEALLTAATAAAAAKTAADTARENAEAEAAKIRAEAEKRENESKDGVVSIREFAELKTEIEREREELRKGRRQDLVTATIKAGKIEPGERSYLEEMYDVSPETARAHVEKLPVRQDLVRELGSDSDESGETDQVTREFENLAKVMGIELID